MKDNEEISDELEQQATDIIMEQSQFLNLLPNLVDEEQQTNEETN